MTLTRRQFGAFAGGTFASLALGGSCHGLESLPAAGDGRLHARPRAGVKTTEGPGKRALGLGAPRDGILQLPPVIPATPMPLVVLLHGAGGSADGVMRRVGSAPAAAGVAVLAPDSRDATWDAIRAGFYGDVAFLDKALEKVFETVAVDPARLAIGGFSDGATYALTLGLINGDLFPRVVAFSPGFVIEGAAHGKPRIFISHGTNDSILPIDRCGRRVAADLKARGYDVLFREFDGDHEVPPEIARDGMDFVARP